jgi:hypothetical protein
MSLESQIRTFQPPSLGTDLTGEATACCMQYIDIRTNSSLNPFLLTRCTWPCHSSVLLPNAAAWVLFQVKSRVICGGLICTERGFLRILWFQLPILIPPNTPKPSITRCQYKRPAYKVNNILPHHYEREKENERTGLINYLAIGFLRLHIGSACYVLHANFSRALIYISENRGDIFLRNIGWLSTDYTALYSRK